MVWDEKTLPLMALIFTDTALAGSLFVCVVAVPNFHFRISVIRGTPGQVSENQW
jgi:hypothetical protein